MTGTGVATPPPRATRNRTAAAWWRACRWVLLLNAAFAAIAVIVALLPREPLRERVRAGFASGVLVQQDWLRGDTWRGSHQYDECLILQMLTNEPGATLPAAAGPQLLVRDETYSGYCATLHDLVVERADPSAFIATRYTRYWHGYMPVAAALLTVVELTAAKRALEITAYGALLLLLAVSLRSRGLLRITGVAFAATAVLFWGLPYYGQLLAHAPGDILVVLAAAGFVAAAPRLARADRLTIPLCAVTGALVVYFEFLTGQLPTAAALLAAAAYASAVQHGLPGGRPGAWKHAAVGLAAFALGAMLTVLIRQLLALAVLGPGVIAAFSGNLVHYMGAPPAGPTPNVLRPFAELFRWGSMLTLGRAPAVPLLFGAGAAAWGLALLAASVPLRGRFRGAAISDVLALAAATGIIVAWVLLLPNHTYIHARFMVRMMVVPIAFGAAAMYWSLVGVAATILPAAARVPDPVPPAAPARDADR